MKSIIINNTKILNPLRIVFSFIFLIAQIVYLLLFAFGGISSAFGSNVDVFSSINLIIGVLDVLANGSVYKALFGATLGVTFFVVLVIIIKNIITSFSSLIASIKNNTEKYNGRPMFSIALLTTFGDTLFRIIFFIVFSGMIIVSPINAVALGVVISGLAIYIIGKIAIYILDKGNLSAALYYILLHDGIPMTALAVLFSLICNIDAFEFFNGFNLLDWILGSTAAVATVTTIQNFFVKPVCFILLQSFALAVTYEALTFYDPKSSINFDTAKRLMITTISVSAIMIGLSIYITNSYSAETIISILKQYISMLTCTIALYFSLKFPDHPFTEDVNTDKNGNGDTTADSENTAGDVSSSQNLSEETVVENASETPQVNENEASSDVDPVEYAVSSVDISSVN